MMLRVWSLTCTVLLLASLLPGCRENEPPAAFCQDLGTDGHPLPPTSGPWHDLTLKDGKADWVPFRDPAEEPELQQADAGEAEAGEPTGIEGEIRELIEEYNAAVAEKDYEGVVEFYVESQASTVEQMIEILPTMLEKVKALGNAVAEKSPDTDMSVMKALDSFTMEQMLRLDVGALTVESDTRVVGELDMANAPSMPAGMPIPPGLGVVNFVFEDDYWYVEMPALSMMTALLPQMQQAAPQMDRLIQQIETGQVPADALAAQFNMMSQMFGQFLPTEQGEDATEQAEEAAEEQQPDEPGEDEGE